MTDPKPALRLVGPEADAPLVQAAQRDREAGELARAVINSVIDLAEELALQSAEALASPVGSRATPGERQALLSWAKLIADVQRVRAVRAMTSSGEENADRRVG